MSDAILCPQCEKRYKLPKNPPATFTCKQCGTLVDLSAFGGGAPPPPAAGSARRTSGRRRSAARSTAASRQPGPRQPAQSKAPVTAIVFVVLLVAVLIAARSGGDDAPPRKPTPPPEIPSLRTDVPVQREPIAPSEGAPSAAGEGTTTRKTKRPPARDDGSLKIKLSRVELKPLAWPESVDEATRAKTEESIRAIYMGGREGIEAEAWLIAQGRPIAGRLISEFVSIEASPGFDNREGTSMAMAIDAVLHKIDGFIERSCNERGQIKSTGVYAGISFITRTAKRWTWWWESGEWQTNPQPPWDPFEDESDETPDGRKAPEAPKDPKKGSGFGKRAGSG
jgi:hypothetical protein